MLHNLLRTCALAPRTKSWAPALILLLLCLPLSAQQSFLLDFGPNDGNNGNATTSPDAGGLHWTNVTNPATSAGAVTLTNTVGTASDYTLSITSNFSTNGINHGGLLAPDAALLDSLAVNTATQDYFFTNGTAALRFDGLDPASGYVFRFFASRDNAEVRTSAYQLTGAVVTAGELQSSGPDIGGGGYNGNTMTLYSTPTILPTADGSVTVQLSRAAGQFAYINLMVVEEVGAAGQVDVESITVNGAAITEPNATLQLTADVTPANATFTGVSWSVDDPTVAEITPDGELIPLTNGTVTVTATSLEPGSTVSGSREVSISNQALRHFFLDLGDADAQTVNADANGNVWNNLTVPEDSVETAALTDSENLNSAYSANVTKSFDLTGNSGDGVDDPDFANLAELAIGSATTDHFFTGGTAVLTVRNLDVSSGYRFRAFGSGTFTGRRNTTYELAGFNGQQSMEIQTSGTDVGGPGVNNNVDQVFRSDVIFPRADGTIDLTVRVSLGRYAYLNALRITEYPGLELCPEVDDRGIVVMGSSVARGQGAPNDMGYAFQYGQLLEERFSAGEGLDWDVTNISVGGNNTVAVLDRWSRDLAPLCDRYVVYGLSLANEGIRNRGQAAFDDFEQNMGVLIQQARERNIVPVVVGNYSRRDFNATDYAFIREMNLLIHQWDVPSVNVLGTNDNGSGNWVSGFEADLGHPNLAGHTEFFHAFVPSLFDALDAGKPQPERMTEDIGLEVGSAVDENPIVFDPEETAHSFTLALEFTTEQAGQILAFQSADGTHTLRTELDGSVVYTSPNGTLSETRMSSGWTNVALTHYYARGTTQLYLDGLSVTGLDEQVAPSEFSIAGATAPETMQLRDFFFWRSGMNADEIAAHVGGAMLKSSLEIYTPVSSQIVDGQFGGALDNLAQSTNALFNSRLTSLDDPALTNQNLSAFPNPTADRLRIASDDGTSVSRILLTDAAGRVVLRSRSTTELSLAGLPAGAYTAVVTLRDGRRGAVRIVKQ